MTDCLSDGTCLGGVISNSWGFLYRRCHAKEVRILCYDHSALLTREGPMLIVGRMQQASLPRSRYIDSVKLQARRNARITIFIQVKLDRPGHEVRPASFGAMRGRPLLSSRRQSARLLQYRPRSQPGGRGS